jgi:hypothetical protein
MASPTPTLEQLRARLERLLPSATAIAATLWPSR